jgi:hypothetical protein
MRTEATVVLRCSPKRRMPVPPSITMRLPEFNTTSRQVVLPPNSRVEGPGEGMEPLVPQNLISTCPPPFPKL